MLEKFAEDAVKANLSTVRGFFENQKRKHLTQHMAEVRASRVINPSSFRVGGKGVGGKGAMGVDY